MHHHNFVAPGAARSWSARQVLAALLGLLLGTACSNGGGGGPNADARIAGLVLSAGTLSPAFQPDVLAYAADVPFSVTEVKVLVTAADPAARITVDGAVVASGAQSAPRPLVAGANGLRIEMTAADGVTTRTYTVTVTRAPAPVLPTLSALALSAGTLTPAFDPFTLLYAATVGYGTDAVQVTATAAAPDATITTNGTAVVSGQPSAPILLAAGQNQVSVRVTAASGTTREYVIAVTRQAAVPALSALVLSAGQLTPTFDPETTAYTATVGYLTEAVTVTATTTVPGATLTTNGTAVASGQPSAPILLAEGPNLLTVRVTTATAAARDYEVVLTRQAAGQFAQEAYVKASNPDATDGFGVRVALSGDTLAVGTWFEDSSATGVDGNQLDNGAFDSGAVYVFTRSGTTWTQQAYLKASNTEASDTFGYSVALDGDTLAVGAIDEDSDAAGVDGDQGDDSLPDSGAVYVFTRSGTTWTQQAYLKASNPGAYDEFGWSVALDGDTLAVAARDEDSSAAGIGGLQGDNGAPNSGAVYVFTRSGATWAQQAYVKASNPGAGDRFGQSVALAGDTLAVGAAYEDSTASGIGGSQADNGRPDSGAVYLFTRSGTAWTQQVYLKASNPDAGDQFGASVALAGDTLAVGAVNESSSAVGIGGDQLDNGAIASGAVYVFTRTGTAWTQQAYVKASNAEANDQFGVCVALSGDTLAAGAFGEASGAVGIDGFQLDNTAISSGAVYMFIRRGTDWSQQAYVKASNTDALDAFGLRLALDGDTLAVGAFGEDGGAAGVGGSDADNSRSNSGAVYVFR